MISLALSVFNFVLILPGCAMFAFGLWSALRKPKSQTYLYAFCIGCAKALHGLVEGLWVIARHSEPASRENAPASLLAGLSAPFTVPLRVWLYVGVVVAVIGGASFFVHSREERAALEARIDCERAAAQVGADVRRAQPVIVEHVEAEQKVVTKIVTQTKREIADAEDLRAAWAIYDRAARGLLDNEGASPERDRTAGLEADYALSAG